MHPYDLPGWKLLGAFPDQEPDDVGSWLLHHEGEALLLEIPPGLTVPIVRDALDALGSELRYVTASHEHEDHLDPEVWDELIDYFSEAEFLDPNDLAADLRLDLAGEPVWLVKAPKHSLSDLVTIFRGVAMTGDIELEALTSVNREVPRALKIASMAHLQQFPARENYRVSTIMSAHLNDFRTEIDWPKLFAC